LFVAGTLGLVVIFLFQKTDLATILHPEIGANGRFIINRIIRFLLNDIFALLIIYALFYERKYLVFSLWVQGAGVFLFLLPYLYLRLRHPEYNGPLISHLHRIILNPTLLLLLIPGFYFQKAKYYGKF
jgi:exosortase F-associated protein